ncbi:MAG: septal ring lytic transglycosylase RlpA family protein [Hyphomicrobiaceae bacterium]|nr:septal ring lytic transglycosylase RlpA family protein [Hyphomicrobiaceae bacterium]
MRTFVLAALAAVTFGLFGATAASAGKWQESILGVPSGASAPVTRAPRSARRSRTVRRTGAGRRVSSRSRSRRVRNRRVRGNSRYERRVRQSRRTSRRSRRVSYRGRGSLSGLASYYWQPQRVAAGGWFNPNALTAAHKSLPFGTRVRVVNLRNGRSVVVRINDRGPYIRGRIIDLSRRAAQVVGMTGAGVVPVRVQILGRG